MSFGISGAKTLFCIPTHLPLIGDIAVSEMMVVSWLVMLIITGLCTFLTCDLKVEHIGKRQALAELIVESAENLARNNTGGNKPDYLIPFVGALLFTSVISNLISPVGLGSPTADLPVRTAWAATVFTMITLSKIETGGLLGYLEGFMTSAPVMTPFNILSEIAMSISMVCCHFGNVLSGVVIDGLIYAALGTASAVLFGLIPEAVGDFLSHVPTLAVGLPAIMSFYFDRLSGIMQAFIFTMLAIIYIANASEGQGGIYNHQHLGG